MTITPTPLTAALAGAFSAIALPLLRDWMSTGSGIDIPLIVAMVVTVAFPAKTFVLGAGTDLSTAARSIDTALLKRIGAWVLAAVGVTGLRALLI